MNSWKILFHLVHVLNGLIRESIHTYLLRSMSLKTLVEELRCCFVEHHEYGVFFFLSWWPQDLNLKRVVDRNNELCNGSFWQKFSSTQLWKTGMYTCLWRMMPDWFVDCCVEWRKATEVQVLSPWWAVFGFQTLCYIWRQDAGSVCDAHRHAISSTLNFFHQKMFKCAKHYFVQVRQSWRSHVDFSDAFFTQLFPETLVESTLQFQSLPGFLDSSGRVFVKDRSERNQKVLVYAHSSEG